MLMDSAPSMPAMVEPFRMRSWAGAQSEAAHGGFQSTLTLGEDVAVFVNLPRADLRVAQDLPPW